MGPCCLKTEDTLERKMTESENIEHTIWIIMAQKYILKVDFKLFRGKGEHTVLSDMT